jgi:hypothetical protein
VITGDPATTTLIDLPVQEPWLFVSVDGPLHFFIHPSNGALMTLEFTDSGLEVALPNPCPSSHDTIPILEGSCLSLSAFPLRDSLFAISGTNGQLLSLAADIDDDPAPPPIDSTPYTAPNRLWTLSGVTTASIEVLGGDCNCAGVLNHSKFILSDSGSRLRFRSTDPEQLIVGFRIFLRTRRPYGAPECVRINGREVPLAKTGQAVCMAALRPEEVKARRAQTLEFGGSRGRRVCIDKIDVFVIDAAAVPESGEATEFDWFADAATVFDFADGDGRAKKGLDGAADHLVQVFVNRAEKVDLSVFDVLVKKLYMSAEFARPARAILAKACRGDADEATAWGAALKEIVRAGHVSDALWRDVWRDLTLLPEEVREDVAGVVWAANQKYDGRSSVVAAFLTG